MSSTAARSPSSTSRKRSPRATRSAPSCRRRCRARLLERVLAVAARAPSGTNTQPWKVYVLTGAAKEALSQRVRRRLRRSRGARAATPRSTPTTRSSGSRPSSTGGARSAGTSTACSASPRPTRTRMHAAALAQLRLLRRAGGPDVHDRPDHAPGQLARLRHVPAERDGRGPRPRPRHLPAGRVDAVPPHHHAGASARRRTSSWSAACRSATRDPDAIENTLVTEREPVASFVKFIE